MIGFVDVFRLFSVVLLVCFGDLRFDDLGFDDFEVVVDVVVGVVYFE